MRFLGRRGRRRRFELRMDVYDWDFWGLNLRDMDGTDGNGMEIRMMFSERCLAAL